MRKKDSGDAEERIRRGMGALAPVYVGMRQVLEEEKEARVRAGRGPGAPLSEMLMGICRRDHPTARWCWRCPHMIPQLSDAMGELEDRPPCHQCGRDVCLTCSHRCMSCRRIACRSYRGPCIECGKETCAACAEGCELCIDISCTVCAAEDWPNQAASTSASSSEPAPKVAKR